jgi:tellurite resistance protein
MEMSMMQGRAKSQLDNRVMNPAFDSERSEHFLNSMYAIAQADGIATSEELIEIDAIAAEFGLTGKESSES